MSHVGDYLGCVSHVGFYNLTPVSSGSWEYRELVLDMIGTGPSEHLACWWPVTKEEPQGLSGFTSGFDSQMASSNRLRAVVSIFL